MQGKSELIKNVNIASLSLENQEGNLEMQK